MSALTEEQRRIKRGEVRPELVVVPLKRGPGRVDDEGREPEKSDEGLHPPGVAAIGAAEPAFYQGPRGLGHRVSPSGDVFRVGEPYRTEADDCKESRPGA